MKTLILILFLTATAFADTLLDKPTTSAGGKVFTKGAAWNRDYREERRRNPGGNEALWCAAADAKEKERLRRASASGFKQNPTPARVFIYR